MVNDNDPLQALVLASKKIATPCSWHEIKPNCLEVSCPIDIDGVTVEGLKFRATARRSLPNESVTLQLEYHKLRKIGGPMCRVEWHPLKAHNNKGMGPKEHQNKLISGHHIHPFETNWFYGAKFVRRGNLPIAIPIEDDVDMFQKLLDFTAKSFNIESLQMVSPPHWEEDLF